MHHRPPETEGVKSVSVVNALTIDVEDYFHVSAFDRVVERDGWGHFESRVCRNTDRLLELFEQFDIRATFFVLGWVAERFPSLVQRIASSGHEVGSHGFEHRLVYDCTPAQFRSDVRRAKAVLESLAGCPVRGYRAPSYSITERSLWALDILIDEGHQYDASIYPIRHDRYGIPSAPRFINRFVSDAGMIWEVPGSTVRYVGMNLPIGGGGYFRHLPYGWTRAGIQRLNEVERQPAIFYLHPWEIDPDQPRLPASLLSRVRHYRNLDVTEQRLTRLLGEFEFDALDAVLDRATRHARADWAPTFEVEAEPERC